jgi:hypothetical protein
MIKSNQDLEFVFKQQQQQKQFGLDSVQKQQQHKNQHKSHKSKFQNNHFPF